MITDANPAGISGGYSNKNKIERAFERPDWYLKKTAYNIRIRVETVKEFVSERQPKDILDIGCGDGSLSLHLLDGSNRLTLLDRSKSMLDIARYQIPAGRFDQVETVNQDFMTALLPTNRFDLILAVGVMAYVENLRSFGAKIVSLLAPGGTLIMECSDAAHFVKRADRAYSAFRKTLGLPHFETTCRSSSEILSAFQELGLKVCGEFRYSQPLPVVRTLLPQALSYRAIRCIYGTLAQNRSARLGAECMYLLKLADSQ